MTSVGTDGWRRGALSREAPAATPGGTVSQLETSDIRTGLWQLCSALRDPMSRAQGSPWGHGGQEEAERDVSRRRPGSCPRPGAVWADAAGTTRFCNSCHFLMFEVGCVTSGCFPHTGWQEALTGHRRCPERPAVGGGACAASEPRLSRRDLRQAPRVSAVGALRKGAGKQAEVAGPAAGLGLGF